MTHELWASLNSRMVEFLDSVTLEKLVADQIDKGVSVDLTASGKRPMVAKPLPKPIKVNAPNSVFALAASLNKS
jgi:Rrf2 family iron-sulfur cluster assembly transcriptional regulator